jgi:hypothetical protein
MTPEGKIKYLTKKILAKFDKGMYVNWPVPSGYGVSMLDAIGAYRGRPFAIETKAPGKTPTPRQQMVVEQMSEAGFTVFVIDGDPGLKLLEYWLTVTTQQVKAWM